VTGAVELRILSRAESNIGTGTGQDGWSSRCGEFGARIGSACMFDVVLARPVFDVGARTFSWSDVVCASKACGAWARMECEAREQLACLDWAAGAGIALLGGEFEREEEGFRRGLGLLAAVELESWLAARGVGVHSWQDYVRGAVLRRRRNVDLGSSVVFDPPADSRFDSALWTQAMCSGVLDDVARRLASRAAVAAAFDQLRDTSDPLAESELVRMERCFGAFCERSVSSLAIDREIERRGLDWLRMEWRYQVSADEEVLREAALCIREDGVGFERVAAAAGLSVLRRRSNLDAVEAELRAQLLGARVGALVGPLRVGGGYWLIEVLDRCAASRDDPEVAERARAAVIDGAVEAEVINRVHWHEQLRER
jgi:hypothetical protein